MGEKSAKMGFSILGLFSSSFFLQCFRGFPFCSWPTRSQGKDQKGVRKRGTIRTETITNENPEILFRFRFVMKRQINSPRISFAFAFVMIMLGTHKPQQQATLTK